jgi:hypothetical protein
MVCLNLREDEVNLGKDVKMGLKGVERASKEE